MNPVFRHCWDLKISVKIMNQVAVSSQGQPPSCDCRAHTCAHLVKRTCARKRGRARVSHWCFSFCCFPSFFRRWREGGAPSSGSWQLRKASLVVRRGGKAVTHACVRRPMGSRSQTYKWEEGRDFFPINLEGERVTCAPLRGIFIGALRRYSSGVFPACWLWHPVVVLLPLCLDPTTCALDNRWGASAFSPPGFCSYFPSSSYNFSRVLDALFPNRETRLIRTWRLCFILFIFFFF